MEVALGEDSDATIMTVIAEKLGENGSLANVLLTQEQAEQVGSWFRHHEQ